MEKVLDKIVESSVDIGIRIIGLLLILIIGFKLIKVATKLIKNGKVFNKLDKSAQSFLISGIQFVLKIILFMTVLSFIGIPMTSMLAILGSFGLALGLALQGGLSNIAGGLMILIFKPFKVGDSIDTHTDSGTVTNISIFYTTLLTPDNREIVLPNGPLSNTGIINYSSTNKRRLDLKYLVSYDSDVEKVKKIIIDTIKKEDILNEEVIVRLGEHNINGLIFYIQVWVKPNKYSEINFNINEKIKEVFDKNNIEIPHLQLTSNTKK